jgi:hypothetical protein
MKHIIKNKFNISYEQINTDIIERGIGSHKYIINFVHTELKKKDRDVARQFKNSIKDLKQYRKESDYDNIEIKINQSKNAISIAKKIRYSLQVNI